MHAAYLAGDRLKQELQTQRETTEKARKAYWQPLAGFVTRHELGLPRNDMKGIPARSVYAMRGTVTIDHRGQQVYPVAAARVVVPVQAVRVSLVAPVRAAKRRTSG